MCACICVYTHVCEQACTGCGGWCLHVHLLHTSQREGITSWQVTRLTLRIHAVFLQGVRSRFEKHRRGGVPPLPPVVLHINRVIVTVHTSHQPCQAWVTSRWWRSHYFGAGGYVLCLQTGGRFPASKSSGSEQPITPGPGGAGL